jgi:hypothetical protein
LDRRALARALTIAENGGSAEAGVDPAKRPRRIAVP